MAEFLGWLLIVTNVLWYFGFTSYRNAVIRELKAKSNKGAE